MKNKQLYEKFNMEGGVKYVHTEQVHNMVAPNIVVPIVLDVLNRVVPPLSPKSNCVNSVVDFGCGLGTWLRAFKENGIPEILGLDGKWCNTQLLFKNIDQGEFQYVDLENPIILEKTYDMAISLEVAEHVSPERADIFVQSLVNAAKIILFSAAIPEQRGFNHINEQWPSYWIEKFQKHGYVFHDVLRSKIWFNEHVEVWYKQNIFLVVREDIQIEAEKGVIFDLVHPELFLLRQEPGGIKNALSNLWKATKNRLKL
jgi:SAM-dependent methyltransferase